MASDRLTEPADSEPGLAADDDLRAVSEVREAGMGASEWNGLLLLVDEAAIEARGIKGGLVAFDAADMIADSDCRLDGSASILRLVSCGVGKLN